MTSTATPFVSPRTPIDLTNCDREPIHIPGAIQPHGVLLGVRESDRVVIQASANAGSILAKSEVVGQTLAALLGDEASATVFAELARGQSRSSLQLATSSGAFATTVHYSDRLAIIELEAAVTRASAFGQPTSAGPNMSAWVRTMVARGADVIKIFASKSIREGGGQTLSDAQIRAACDEARRAGK